MLIGEAVKIWNAFLSPHVSLMTMNFIYQKYITPIDTRPRWVAKKRLHVQFIWVFLCIAYAYDKVLIIFLQ